MAQDPTQGPVSQYDSEGFPINPTRSEVINSFGEILGNRLIQAGFSSLSSISVAVDSVFDELGFSEDEIALLREKAPFTGAPTQEEVEKVTADVEEDEAEIGEADEDETGEGEADLEKADEDEAEEDEAEPKTADEPIPTIEMDVTVLDSETTRANLSEMKLGELREICKRDDIQPARSIDETVDRIMEAWFPAPPEPEPVVEEGPQMSARVRRIKQASQQQ